MQETLEMDTWAYVDVTGPVSYNIKLEYGRHWKRHQDHIRSRLVVPDDS